jgi:Zn-dependent protease
MRMSWKLGRVAGIDLYLHPTFLLLLAWLWATGGTLGLLLSAATFGCVLLHELGHALAARGFGIGTEDITLYPIGGVARLRRMPRAPGAELLITLAGPAVNVLIAGVLAAALAVGGWLDPGSAESMVGAFVAQLMWINVVLAAFNMLPAFPMDGGRVLRALLSGPLGRLRATQIAAGVGRVLAVAFGLFCLANGLLMPAVLSLFVYLAAGAERDRVLAEERPRPAPGFGGMWVAPPGYYWVHQGNGAWQLAPIPVPSYEAPHDRPFDRTRPWL